jgi:hypothetical protein
MHGTPVRRTHRLRRGYMISATAAIRRWYLTHEFDRTVDFQNFFKNSGTSKRARR